MTFKCNNLQVRALLSHESAHKLLILAGESVEESGELLFHRGLFSPKHLKQILTELVRVGHSLFQNHKNKNLRISYIVSPYIAFILST